MPNKKKELEPVDDPQMAQRYLRYGHEFHEPISCLIGHTEIRFDASFKSIDPSAFAMELDIEDEHFANLSAQALEAVDAPQAPIRLSYSVNEATFFIQGRIQNRTTRRLSVRAEMPMYKLQRREAMRIKVMDSHKASIHLGASILPLYDISAGGISVVVGINEEKTYTKGQAFPASVLRFLGKEIKVDLEVKNILSNSKDGLKWKIGLSFLALPPQFEQMIAREAYLHSHKIWSRWL